MENIYLLQENFLHKRKQIEVSLKYICAVQSMTCQNNMGSTVAIWFLVLKFVLHIVTLAAYYQWSTPSEHENSIHGALAPCANQLSVLR